MAKQAVLGTFRSGASVSIYGQIKKVPCKLDVEFTTKASPTSLNFITSEVLDYLGSNIPRLNLSEEFGVFDFEELDPTKLCLDLLNDVGLTSCTLIVNGVQTYSAMAYQPLT